MKRIWDSVICMVYIKVPWYCHLRCIVSHTFSLSFIEIFRAQTALIPFLRSKVTSAQSLAVTMSNRHLQYNLCHSKAMCCRH